MEIKEFIKLFRQKINEVLDSELIIPSKRSEDFNFGDWTFLFNCAVYDLVKEYNQKNKANLAICAEPDVEKTPVGRGGYSDILICSKDGNKNFIIIEHENFPHKGGVSSDMVRKLSKFKAESKLIITYYPKKKDEIIKKLQSYVNDFFGVGEVLHLFISKWETACGEDYEYVAIYKE